MIFEFTATPQFDFITDFAKKFKIPVQNNSLVFPHNKGQGYIRKVAFSDDFRLLIHRYKLKEDFTIIRNQSVVSSDLISIFFYNNEQPLDLVYNKESPVKFSRKNESAIQVTTNQLNSTIRFPAHAEIYYMVVGITSGKLSSLLNTKKRNHTIQAITSGNGSVLYFESMNVETEQLLRQISAINMNDALSSFAVQIKVEEMLYLLFDRLLKRENKSQRSVNNTDAEKLMALRSLILSDLSIPPVLSKLASLTGMSETKMKQLFKQTFGDSIYSFYQKLRMEEAAFLLKQGAYSVSEVGYELGFTNLSHFSRLFEKQYGVTPKRFVTGRAR